MSAYTEKVREAVSSVIRQELPYEVALQVIESCAADRKSFPADLAELRSLWNQVATITKLQRAANSVDRAALAPVPNGTYTVVIAGVSRTLRLVDDWRENAAKGSQVAQFLNGPDNESNYAGFAFVTGRTFRVWRKFATDSAITSALSFLVHTDRAGWMSAGEAYAVASARCFRCNRPLTVVSSISAGLGPVCAKKIAG